MPSGFIATSNPKQPNCKKKCAAPKKAIVKKDVKSKVAAKKWLDGRLMAKILITTAIASLINSIGNDVLRRGTETWLCSISNKFERLCKLD